ncbi:hypothetical protein ACHAXA_003642 [Cyclostephanos tholiformis]|uniref:3'-5' exonuclease domain-containing protein n=1 Tax=Cyclostephanos tholiformis TaxID=382380 RepID=A0ABD3SQ21_9STRA
MHLSLLSTFSLFFIIMESVRPTTNAASSITTHQPSSFLHSTTANQSSKAITLKRKHSVDVLCGSLDGESRGDAEDNRSSRNVSRNPKRRTRSPHHASSLRPIGHPKQPQMSFKPKTGLNNMCPPLDGSIGAPPLPVLTTKDPNIIQRWLEDNVVIDGNEYAMLGFDLESIAKPPWMPERASLPDGPATIQLSTTTSCIIIQLSRCGDGSALYGPEILRQVINNPKIIKVGVGIDDDALELYRWSKSSLENAPGRSVRENQQQSSQLWEMTSRFDIGCILQKNKRSGIRELAQKILGAEINKSKILSMSNWGTRHLTLDQISYAARDAWVSAAVVERLQMGNNIVFRAKSLMNMDFMKSQRSMDDIDARAKARKAAKLDLKEILEGQMKKTEGKGADEEERIRTLHNLLEFYRPEQPPAFDKDILKLPLL